MQMPSNCHHVICQMRHGGCGKTWIPMTLPHWCAQGSFPAALALSSLLTVRPVGDLVVTKARNTFGEF